MARRVALITIHSLPNYGSVLQAYAAARVLEEAGIECDIIDYAYPNSWHRAHGAPSPDRVRKFIARAAVPAMKLLGLHSQHVLDSRLADFKRRHYRMTRPFPTLGSLEEADWSVYDAVIAGSDQIWNPRFQHGDKAFLLSFVPDGVRRLSFASSFAADSIPGAMRPLYHEALSKFHRISVREEGGLRILKDELSLSVPAVLTLDPTLLLTPEQWLETASRRRVEVPSEPYIILYGMYYAFEPRPYIFEAARRLGRQTGCRIIALSGYPDPSCPSDLAVDNRTDATVEEFITLFSRAEAVVTSSFHGTAFALNFGRPLVSIVPSGGDDRQSSLLRLVGADCCITPSGTPTDRITPFYDTGTVGRRLDTLRRSCIADIVKAIG